MPIALVNMGGVRGEETFFAGLDPQQTGSEGVRSDLSTQELLPALVAALEQPGPKNARSKNSPVTGQRDGASVFKDMLS